VGAEGAEIDDDVTVDLASGGLDGFELETIFEFLKGILVGILELIGFGV